MKKYIILTGSIIDVGGSQLYSKNKKKYLEEKGWDVSIYSFQSGQILIDELKGCSNNIIHNLKFSPNLFTAKIKKKVIDKIIWDKTYEEVVVESHSINLSLWGEMVAQKVNGKNVIVLVDETFEKLTKSKLSFLNFKHERRELAGINEKSLELLFRGEKELLPEDKYYLKLVSNNVVQNTNNEIVNRISRADINIGCITRLEKSYVIPLVNQVIEFARLNQELKIQLIFFGGSHYEEFEKQIRKKILGVSNLSLVITGYLYPIPKKIFQITDIFIGAAGSARTSLNEGVLTLTVDVRDGNPIGLLGIDTHNTLYSDKKNTKSLSSLLHEVLITNQMHKKEIINNSVELESIDFRKEFVKHTQFINNSSQNKKYYPFREIKPDIKELVKLIVLKTVGNQIENKISYLKIKKNMLKLPRT